VGVFLFTMDASRKCGLPFISAPTWMIPRVTFPLIPANSGDVTSVSHPTKHPWISTLISVEDPVTFSVYAITLDFPNLVVYMTDNLYFTRTVRYRKHKSR